ncbi:MAG: hypothetical protein WKF47_04185 [Geodermatophilaceae bacterium]
MPDLPDLTESSAPRQRRASTVRRPGRWVEDGEAETLEHSVGELVSPATGLGLAGADLVEQRVRIDPEARRDGSR